MAPLLKLNFCCPQVAKRNSSQCPFFVNDCELITLSLLTQSPVEPPAPATSSKVDPPQPVSVKPSVAQPNINKPALPKKPDLHGDSAGKNKRISGEYTHTHTSQGCCLLAVNTDLLMQPVV